MVRDPLCVVGTWLLTYLLHSTLLLGGVGLMERFGWLKSAETREWFWRVALLGGLMTTTAHCLPSIPPAIGLQKWTLGQWIAEQPTDKIANSTHVVDLSSKVVDGGTKRTLYPADLTYAYAERFALLLCVMISILAIVGVTMNLSRLVWLGLQARSQLCNRVAIDPQRREEWDGIASACSPRVPKLSVSANLDGPISLPNGEIVAPSWIFDTLSLKQRQAIYAHELAHQRRRDPIWLLWLHLLNAVLWIQPLHRLARRRLIHLAELQADAWASRRLGESRSLAESLALCAEHLTERPAPAFGSSFSSTGGIVERVDRLLDGIALARPSNPVGRRLVALIGLMAALLLMPGCDVDSDMAYRTGERISVTRAGDQSIQVTIRRTNLFVKLTAQGNFQFDDQHADVQSMEADGRFQFAESCGNVKRVYRVTSDSQGALTRSFTLNGKPSPITEDVREWLRNSLSKACDESNI